MNIYPWLSASWNKLQELRLRQPHGLLLKGNTGIGKFELAAIFAKSLLCQQPDNHGFACGACQSCHWFEQGTHPDFRLLQPEILNLETEETQELKPASGRKPSKQISVEQIRSLENFIGMSAHQGGQRIVIIHPAEAMNTNAANALLKNLEEPPGGLLFILISHKPQQLLPTILSRCLSLAIPLPEIGVVTRWLEEQGVKHPAEALSSAGFSPLLAAQPDAHLGNEEREKLLRAARQPGTMDVFSLAEALQKTEQVLVVQWLQQWSYDLSAMKLAGRLRYHSGEEAVLRKLVAGITPLNLARLQGYLQSARREAQHTLNPRLFFETLFLTYRQLMLP